MFETEVKRPRAIAAALDTGEYDVEVSLQELSRLADTAGIDVVFEVTQRKDHPDSGTFFGKGKLDEIKELIENEEVDTLLFDDELSPMQIRNIENITGLAPIDRTMLILDIFASQAKTKEGEVQVELAQHRYRLPRLAGAYTAMSRLGGGIGTRGPGETKLETDRRYIESRINQLQKELVKIDNHRQLTRRARLKSGVKSVAIVGYTNVGKSTLLNFLTGAGVLAENKLFATLDPTARKLTLKDGSEVLMVDTVGFVSRLPHHLVKAFSSTLKESVYADLILQVCDITSPTLAMEMQTTKETLNGLDIGDTPVLTVFNKCDSEGWEENIPAGVKDYMCISAKTGFGVDELLDKIAEILFADDIIIKALVPFAQAGLETTLRQKGKLAAVDYRQDGIYLEGKIAPEYAHLFEKYKV